MKLRIVIPEEASSVMLLLGFCSSSSFPSSVRNILCKSRARVVFPLDDGPDRPTMIARGHG